MRFFQAPRRMLLGGLLLFGCSRFGEAEDQRRSGSDDAGSRQLSDARDASERDASAKEGEVTWNFDDSLVRPDGFDDIDGTGGSVEIVRDSATNHVLRVTLDPTASDSRGVGIRRELPRGDYKVAFRFRVQSCDNEFVPIGPFFRSYDDNGAGGAPLGLALYGNASQIGVFSLVNGPEQQPFERSKWHKAEVSYQQTNGGSVSVTVDGQFVFEGPGVGADGARYLDLRFGAFYVSAKVGGAVIDFDDIVLSN